MAVEDYGTKPHVTVEWLRENFSYDPNTGILRREVRGPGRANIGPVGCKDAHGYLVVVISGRWYKVHRLVWGMHFGVFPTQDVDHINGVRSDNRIENLREVSKAQNAQNRHRAPSNNLSSGKLGVSFHAVTGKWSAYITDPNSRKKCHLGVFVSPEEAHAVYLEAKRRLHPGCTI